MAKNNNYIPAFVTGDVTVLTSHLKEPDEFKRSKFHAITVEVNDELQKVLDSIAGDTKINSLRTSVWGKDSDNPREITSLTVKTKVYTNENKDVFEDIVGLDNKPTSEFPFSRDVVRLILQPKLWEGEGDDEDAISFYLQKVQIREKNSSSVDFTDDSGESSETSESGASSETVDF